MTPNGIITLLTDFGTVDGYVGAMKGVILAEAPLTPLYFNTKIWLMSPRVRGWQEDGLWSRTYHQVSLETK